MLNPSNIYLFTVVVQKPFCRLSLLGLENKTFFVETRTLMAISFGEFSESKDNIHT